MIYPFDERDQLDQAKEYYERPLRVQNQHLVDENMHLKRLLRENDISWSSPVGPHGGRPRYARRVASSTFGKTSDDGRRMPYLPMEVQLRILKYAMTSKYPIIDPLSKTTQLNMTTAEAKRDNQIAVGFLATCKAFNVEASHVLWANNSFIFTTHVALRNFSNLALEFRKDIKHINLRIIAQYYDDMKRTHKLSRSYHRQLKRDVPLRVHQRSIDANVGPKGFRSYAWTQAVDFFAALRPPYDPTHDIKASRPRLLPGLETMRIDFVNFAEDFLPMPGTDFHAMVAHELEFTLNELMVTGIPCCEAGEKASSDLAKMVKDNGLHIDGGPAFLQMKTCQRPLGCHSFNARVICFSRRSDIESDSELDFDELDFDELDFDELDELQKHIAIIPACPPETGHPESDYDFMGRPTVWKRVPVSRDSDERKWVEFDRKIGYPTDEVERSMRFVDGEHEDEDDDDDDDGDILYPICAKCGVRHIPFSREEP